MKRTPFKPKPTWKKLRQISPKRCLELRTYSKIRRQFLLENPNCSVCLKRVSTDVHHKKGRGIYLNVVEFFLACCAECHRKITVNGRWAIQQGYSIDRLS